MVKCGTCGKFLSSAEAATCSNCRSCYHRLCAGVQTTGPLSTSWHCMDCKKSLVRDSQIGAPPPAPVGNEDVANQMDTSPINKTALDVTQELNLDILRAELSMFKEEFLKLVRSEFQQLHVDLSELKSSLKSTNDRMSNLEERVAVLENQQAQPLVSPDINAVINQLKSEINDRDQDLFGNDIQLSNIPEASGENPTHTAILVATKLGVKLKERDIVSAERVGGRRINATQATAPVETRPRFLVVRLARRDKRDELLESARVRRGMTTADLGLPGTATRFYVNERLTKANRELFRCAREAGSRQGWQFVWAKRGRILARHKPGDPTCHIRCEADILRTFGVAPLTGENSVL